MAHGRWHLHLRPVNLHVGYLNNIDDTNCVDVYLSMVISFSRM